MFIVTFKLKTKMNALLECLLAIALAMTALADNCQFPSQKDKISEVQQQLQRLDSLRSRTFSTNYNINGENLVFKFGLCATPISLCKGQPDATVIVENNGVCNGSIGKYSSAFLSYGSNWVSVTFSDGDKRDVLGSNASLPQASTVTFVCDSKSKESFKLANTNRAQVNEQWHYLFILNTDTLCDKPPLEGLSAGSVLCIIFFTVAGVYFLFGFLYRRFVVRAKGVEQIPNYDVWKELGNLVADGCDYMCRCGSRQEAKMYQGIGGDPLGNESETEERDDRLLPM